MPKAGLHINGGGSATRADAKRESLAAIAFALEGDPRDYDREAETVTLDVSVAPAAWGGGRGGLVRYLRRMADPPTTRKARP
jgi:hypothetical protein